MATIKNRKREALTGEELRKQCPDGVYTSIYLPSYPDTEDRERLLVEDVGRKDEFWWVKKPLPPELQKGRIILVAN